ncbi:MAG: hypothetical protein AB7E72_21805 [Lysobacterales bacterium]
MGTATVAVPGAAHAASMIEQGSAASSAPKSSGIVVLTTSLGLMGQEILSHGAKRASDQDVLQAPSSVLAYAEIDGLDFADRNTLESYRLLVSMGTPLLLESDSWNVEHLHEVVKHVFPGANTDKLKNTGVVVRSLEGGGVSVMDADFSPVQELAGIAPESTSEAISGWSEGLEKGSSPVHWTVRFAAKAYETSPSDSSWRLRYNNNVVDVWQSNSSASQCLVAWRGSDDLGDWLRNIQSLVSKQIPRTPSGNSSGAGFVDRLANFDDILLGEFARWGCSRVVVTGHSLGGAMSHIHTLQLMFDTRYTVSEMRVYNSARALNDTAYSSFRNRLSGVGLGIYCRDGDPVNPVPFGLQRGGPSGFPQYGCTYWGGMKSLFNPSVNHSLSHWSTEL